MINSIEVTGKTENDAIASALDQLGLSRDEVSIEIVERAKSGFLGIGSTPAVIRVSYEAKEASLRSRVEEFLTGLLQRMGVTAEMTITERKTAL